MAQTTDILPKIYDCKRCNQKIRLQKVGERENGSVIWKQWNEAGTEEHQCKKPTNNTAAAGGGSNNKRSSELLESIDKKLGEILAEIKRQGMR